MLHALEETEELGGFFAEVDLLCHGLRANGTTAQSCADPEFHYTIVHHQHRRLKVYDTGVYRCQPLKHTYTIRRHRLLPPTDQSPTAHAYAPVHSTELTVAAVIILGQLLQL